jgi:ribonuclease HII
VQRENELRLLGHSRIAGVDEAGRGPLAGPVVAAAVVLPPDFEPQRFTQLNDSKQLTAALRAELFTQISATFEYGVGIVDAPTIDLINIRQASWRAMQHAVADLQCRAASAHSVDFVLLDGLPYGSGPWPYEAIVKGDSRSFSIAAASIIAKETRDRLMIEYSEQFPSYGFAQHKGYPSPQHLRALAEHGPCEIHRRSYAPVQRVLAEASKNRSSKNSGLKADQVSPGGNVLL